MQPEKNNCGPNSEVAFWFEEVAFQINKTESDSFLMTTTRLWSVTKMKTDDLSAPDFDWHNCDYEIKEQDRFLPIANVGRVMKKALPKHAKLSKELKECIQECVSEFISFITSQASDKCKIEKRKTLNGEDILWSMFTLGFENYAETLKIYLAKYRQVCIVPVFWWKDDD